MSNLPSILIVDDDDHFRVQCRLLLNDRFKDEVEIFEAASIDEAKKIHSKITATVWILDVLFEEKEQGTSLLEDEENRPDTEYIVITKKASSKLATKALELGAIGFVRKKDEDWINLLELHLRSALRVIGLSVGTHLKPINPKLTVCKINDPALNIINWIEKIAKSGSKGPVMFVGQPGVGKEEFARELHLRSSRSSKPFVVIDGSNIVESLKESELFGYKKGAFSEAKKDRPGLFEIADGGVAFIDEIDKLGINVQNSLLRFVETGETRRVGDTKTRNVDVILMLASNINPKSEEGRRVFSEPLIGRMDRFLFHIPPLSERSDSVSELAKTICARVAANLKRSQPLLLPEAIEWLKIQAKEGKFDKEKGNIRGLKNLIERVLVFAIDDDTIGVRQLQLADGFDTSKPFEDVNSDKTEKKHNKGEWFDENVFSLTYESFRIAQKERDADEWKMFMQNYLKEYNYNSGDAAQAMMIDRSLFSKKFKEVVGITANEWSKNNKGK